MALQLLGFDFGVVYPSVLLVDGTVLELFHFVAVKPVTLVRPIVGDSAVMNSGVGLMIDGGWFSAKKLSICGSGVSHSVVFSLELSLLSFILNFILFVGGEQNKFIFDFVLGLGLRSSSVEFDAYFAFGIILLLLQLSTSLLFKSDVISDNVHFCLACDSESEKKVKMTYR